MTPVEAIKAESQVDRYELLLQENGSHLKNSGNCLEHAVFILKQRTFVTFRVTEFRRGKGSHLTCLPSLGLLPPLCLDQLRGPQIWSLTTVPHFCEEGRGGCTLLGALPVCYFQVFAHLAFTISSPVLTFSWVGKMLEFMLHTKVSYCCTYDRRKS